MTRATLLEAVKAIGARSALASEIEHFMGIDDREYAYDEVSALFDAYDLAEKETKDRAVIMGARLLLMEHGFYRVMPLDEAINTFRSNGSPPYDFRYNGEAYTTDFAVEEWQWPETTDEV